MSDSVDLAAALYRAQQYIPSENHAGMRSIAAQIGVSPTVVANQVSGLTLPGKVAQSINQALISAK